MLRFTIRDVLLVTLVVATGVEWLVDRRAWRIEREKLRMEMEVLQAVSRANVEAKKAVEMDQVLRNVRMAVRAQKADLALA